ncbi:hypothetical protein [Actinomadura sp. NPDC048394]|uniref:hypothetical protein n=1 Tax=Actinomadura sp. NPDC048394 TaxID=3158223 RepID=UPI0033C5A89D
MLAGLVKVGIGGLEGARDPATRARTAEVLRAWVADGDLDERVTDGEMGRAVVGLGHGGVPDYRRHTP